MLNPKKSKSTLMLDLDVKKIFWIWMLDMDVKKTFLDMDVGFGCQENVFGYGCWIWIFNFSHYVRKLLTHFQVKNQNQICRTKIPHFFACGAHINGNFGLETLKMKPQIFCLRRKYLFQLSKVRNVLRKVAFFRAIFLSTSD